MCVWKHAFIVCMYVIHNLLGVTMHSKVDKCACNAKRVHTCGHAAAGAVYYFIITGIYISQKRVHFSITFQMVFKLPTYICYMYVWKRFLAVSRHWGYRRSHALASHSLHRCAVLGGLQNFQFQNSIALVVYAGFVLFVYVSLFVNSIFCFYFRHFCSTNADLLVTWSVDYGHWW